MFASDLPLSACRIHPVRLCFAVLTLLFGSVFSANADINGDGKTVICFVGHKTSHGFMNHEYSAGCHLIEDWLKAQYPDANIEGRHAIPWPENEEEFFKDADGVVFFCSGGGGHVVNRHVQSFDKVMRTGAGLACLHYGVEVPIGPSAKGMLNWMGGYFEANWSVNPHWVAEFKSFSKHPVANGVKPFKSDDEWYFHMRFQEGMKGVEPILSAIAPQETMKRKDGPHSGNPTVRKAVSAGEPQHVAWTYERGADYNKGRGFGFTGLHYHKNWMEDSFRKTVLNGVAWTSGLVIPDNGVETEKPTVEFLEANALKYGGDQGKKKKAAPKKAANPNVKPIFESKPVENGKTPGHAAEIAVKIPEGAKEIYLVIDDHGDLAFDWANWAEPRLIMADGSEKKLTDLNWKSETHGWGMTHKNKNAGGKPMSVQGKSVEYGIGTHAPSVVAFDLPAGVKEFKARGVLDDGGAGQNGGNAPSSVKFLVYSENPGEAVAKRSSGGGGGTADEALDSLEVHPDLEAQLFASEPMIGSPSSIDIDAKGRVWVCDVVNYRRNKGKREGGDKIMILEDTDGDGKADKSTVFYQGDDVDSAHGICVLGDRVIISCGDDVFSLYDRDGDGKADEGSKELMFTKIGGTQHDHGIHAFHFGPDGRLYFNFGNAGKQLCDAEGNLITDINGVKCTNQGNRPFQEGMVFRCDLDGKNVEMLGWNFRNNWEACVDSFGTIWQSDNDDDGNKGVRINYVMEYGNYGYKDEITGAGWRDPRPGMSEEIPERHWHLNDPGVVPNFLQTGAGSPTGICVYEGELLPEVFRGQVIHCDAGPNVVRAYPRKKDGAGYTGEILNILSSKTDRWFRPSDVCVAPDGSLFVADWYDPGVGGHGMGDIEKGRIYRVVPKGGNKSYAVSKKLPGEGAGKNSKTAVSLYDRFVKSPNMAERFHIWNLFADPSQGFHEHTTKRLIEVYEQADITGKARLIWFTTSLFGDKNPLLTGALDEENPDLRITGLRAWRQCYGEHRDGRTEAFISVLEKLADDKEPQVRREVAVALRYHDSKEANEIWAKLAGQYDGKDRWYLEALGIGADLFWDERLAAMGDAKLHEDIVWRSRGADSATKIAETLVASSNPSAGYLRGLDFQPKESQEAAFKTIFQKAQPELALAAAAKIGRGQIEQLEGGKARLEELLEPVRGKAEFITLAEKLNLRGFEEEVADFIVANPNAPESVNAARVLLRDQGQVRELLKNPDDLNRASAIATAIGKTNERSVGGLLGGLLQRDDTPIGIQRVLVDAMAMSSNGGNELLKIAKAGKLDESLKTRAALAFARSPDQRLRNDAANILPMPKALGADNFKPLPELAGMKSDPKAGAELFAKATCATCHQVKGNGVNFGPDLSEIGNKLSREGMFQAILYPSAAISHGFHGVTVEKKDGNSMVGFVTGETDAEVQLRLPGGVQQSVAKKEIKSQKENDVSLMPPGLAAIVGEQGLVDLVGYLQTLK